MVLSNWTLLLVTSESHDSAWSPPKRSSSYQMSLLSKYASRHINSAALGSCFRTRSRDKFQVEKGIDSRIQPTLQHRYRVRANTVHIIGGIHQFQLEFHGGRFRR